MTTGRINQVACRAARAPIHHTRWSTGASTTRSATDRATDRRETRAHRWKTIDARATRTEPRWLQHVRAQCKMWVGVARATALSREQPRAPPEPETTRYKERAAASRRTESPLRPAEHPLATRGAQHTQIMQGRTDDTPHWQGSQPEQQAGAHRPSQAKSRLRPRAGPCCAGPSAPQPKGRGAHAHCTRWLAPDACEQSRNRSHNSKMPWHARASLHMEPSAHGRRTSRNTGPRAAARPEPLAVPSTLAAPETGRALRGSPPSPRAFRRGSSNDLPRNGPRKLTRARTLQACNRVRFRREQPCNSATLCSAAPHALLHVWSPKARPCKIWQKKKKGPPSAAACAHVPTGARRGVCVCARVCCVACRVRALHLWNNEPHNEEGPHCKKLIVDNEPIWAHYQNNEPCSLCQKYNEGNNEGNN
jgi:hypothetical protein